MVSIFLILTELNSCNAELKIYKLPLRNLIGIATDNCSTIVGINNDLYQKLKDIPSLILIKCICHLLQLTISHAANNTLSHILEYLISEIGFHDYLLENMIVVNYIKLLIKEERTKKNCLNCQQDDFQLRLQFHQF